MSAPRAQPHGVVLIDKPRGPTSHDVVSLVRRALKTRAVGHAGTLDPMATGLLVVLVGDATRLAPWVSGETKRYRATVLLGVGTDSLDAQGKVTETAPLSPEIRAHFDAELTRALDVERARGEQIPPAVSAIHVDGERAHELVRRGEVPVLAARVASARAIELESARLDGEGAVVEVSLTVTKGYYVRSFARDLGASLGVPAHLTALRRTHSGALSVDDAVAPAPAEGVAAALVAIPHILPQLLPCVSLTDEGASRARQGKRLAREHFVTVPEPGIAAWLHQGNPVALGELSGDEARIVRGFPTGSTPAS